MRLPARFHNKKPVAKQLKEARLARGLTIVELSEKLGISRQAVSKHELNTSCPSEETICKLSEVLAFPVPFFYKEGTYEPEKSVTFFRSMKTSESCEREMIRIRNKWSGEIFFELNKYVKFPDVNIPNVEKYIKDEYNLEDMIVITDYLRNYWGAGKGPIDNVTLLLEKNGFIISSGSIHSEKSDACSELQFSRPVIFIGKQQTSCVRNRFNLAHELGHILLHSHITESELSNPKTLSKIEKEAHLFASCFLMPEDTFISEVVSVSIDYLIGLKRRWKTSIQSMIYRFEISGLLSDSQILQLRKKISYRYGRKSEPLDEEMEIEKPILLKKAIELIITNNLLTIDDLKSIFCLNAQDIELICGLPSGYLVTNSSTVINIDFLNKSTLK